MAKASVFSTESDGTTYVGFLDPANVTKITEANIITGANLMIIRVKPHATDTTSTTIMLAEGTNKYDKQWSERATYTYYSLIN